MEDDGLVITKNKEKHSVEATGAVNQPDSTSKISPNELSPDSTSEIINPPSETDQLDSLVVSKVNGDCGIECSVPFPSTAFPCNNNNSSSCKISLEINNPCKEKSFIDDDIKFDTQKKDVPLCKKEVDSVSTNEMDQPKNLNELSEQKCEQLNLPEEGISSNEILQCSKSEKVIDSNEVTSTLEEKNTADTSDIMKSDNKFASSKSKKSVDTSSVSLSKINEPFKPPTRLEMKSSSKMKEIVASESNQKDVPNKIADKTRSKRKSEDRNTVVCDGELNDTEKFPIQYKGFKKKTGVNENNEKRLNLKWNPFNPSCKPNRKSSKCLPSRLPVGDEMDCSSLQQSEYAQYLGLQPILKFRCSNCGSSAFQSMVALNTHQLECTKSGKENFNKLPSCLSNVTNEHKSTNIKLTRKVFLCSACGTYYEHWNLFLHMREVHRRYICLYCLGMFSVAEKLSEHLLQKHKITLQNFSNVEDFQKHSYQTFFMLCLSCDKVFSEMDDFYGHTCANKKHIDGVDTNKSETTSNQETNSTQSNEASNNIVTNKTGGKKTREVSKKSTVTTRSSQLKKDESLSGNSTKKDDNISSEPKDEIKPNDACTNKILETVNCSNVESVQTENNSTNQEEMKSNEMKSITDQDLKQESQVSGDIVPSTDKAKSVKKNKSLPKKVANKRKRTKDTEDENDISISKIKKVSEEEEQLDEPSPTSTPDENLPPVIQPEPPTEVKEELTETQAPPEVLTQESRTEEAQEDKIEPEVNNEKVNSETPKEESSETLEPDSSMNVNSAESKNKLQANLLKFKLPGIESDGESDDSQKLSLVVDENATSDTENKASTKSGENSATDSDKTELQKLHIVKGTDSNNQTQSEGGVHDITLASEDVAVMALTLDAKIENIPIQTVLKECVRTSCMSCNYCRHAVKIAVNGKQLALHILSEHRFMPIKNETPEDVINKLKTSLETLQTMFFNTETYDSSDPSIHVPYDQDSSFDCFQCNYVTSSHRDLFAHKRKSHTKSLLLCIMCKSNFYSYSELLCHLCPGTYNAEIQFHNVDINFRCCFCRLDTIPSAFRLMVHLRKTHHTCDICLENGVDQQKLSTHMWKHKLNHLCYRCGIAYASKPDITKHLFWKHGHESVLCKKCLQKKWPHVYHFCIPPTSFICEECNTSFSKAVALKVHKRIHGNDFPYTCTECNKKFVSKKLLQRHEERHIAIKNNVRQDSCEINKEEEQKEEIINVTSLNNENKESCSAADFSDSKETEPKDKSHKKHKKDKDKKDKQVVDVYDLPPLNLSSESDSSDEDNNVNDNVTSVTDSGGVNLNIDDKNKEKLNLLENKEIDSTSSVVSEDPAANHINIDTGNVDSNSSKTLFPPAEDNIPANDETKHLENEEVKQNETNAEETAEDLLKSIQESEANITTSEKTEQECKNFEDTTTGDKAISNKEVEDIWKNFYNTNPQTSNLPYPLCAIKSEIALGIIMGDHDYCHQPAEVPLFSEDTPSTSGNSIPLINDQLEEVTEPPLEKVNDVSITKDVNSTSSPVTSPKKKPKSPKKKNSKGENENNSSSSSDSSSESSSSSCSCGPNCSCSSSSSNSSSSSSSDSESSVADEGTKQERKRKKRERHSKTKSDPEPEIQKEQPEEPPPPPEKTLPVEPVDPPIRESELETDETTTDEEFYDQQPQRIANQLLAEKRNQLMLLASAANVNNGNASPSPVVDVVQPDPPITPKQKVKTKRKRKPTTKGKTGSEKSVPNSHNFPQYVKDNEPISKPTPQYHINVLPTPEPKLPSFVAQNVALTETTGSGSETEKSRSSKRRRIPNKFYGYSSGDEEEKPAPSPKWKKQENTNQQARMLTVHPPTPRIQLTVPKQLIRKPYKLQKPPPKPQPSSSDSTDSGSEVENQRTLHVPATATSTPAPTPVINQDTSATTTSQKNEKDVYCYCRCPYDEVSEMIACDDENCEIEWFHFECVGILVPPKGQWFCPGCRKARGLPT